MKVSKNTAVKLLVALGFAKAGSWDEAKLASRLAQVPVKVAEDDENLKGHEDLYSKLAVLGDGEEVEFIVEDAAEAAPKKKKTAPAAEPESEEKPSKKSPKKDKAPKSDPVNRKSESGGKESYAAKPTAPKSKTASKSATPKPGRKSLVDVPKDSYGCREGTIAFKVNAVVSDQWLSEQEIADAAGVSLDQARGRLYWAAEQSKFEHRRMIQYRILAPAKKASKAKA